MRPTRAAIAASLLAVLLLAGCAHSGRLAEYDFRDRSLGVVANVPPRPDVDTGPFVSLDGRSALGAVLKVGSSLYKEAQAAKLRARLDTASIGLDLSDRIATAVLDRTARYLGTRPISDPNSADFQLEVDIREYGVDAHEWDARARFHVKARLLLLDRTGREVWKADVDEDEPITRGWFPGGSAASDVVTGSALGDLAVPELRTALGAVADHAADRLAEKLRQGMEKARDR